mmetsp:Transcript_26882/g.37109  ORF Transcript_26882/g.37109 Transcript_26882/m.37109 type:complete len:119 (-) Transcript_26882:76-432(-)
MNASMDLTSFSRSDMSRQFKAMQEKHLQKIDTLEKHTQQLQEDLDAKDVEIATLRVEYEEKLAAKELVIKDLKHRQEVMAQEFAEMLKETLDKMAECLESTDDKGINFDKDPNQSLLT